MQVEVVPKFQRPPIDGEWRVPVRPARRRVGCAGDLLLRDSPEKGDLCNWPKDHRSPRAALTATSTILPLSVLRSKLVLPPLPEAVWT